MRISIELLTPLPASDVITFIENKKKSFLKESKMTTALRSCLIRKDPDRNIDISAYIAHNSTSEETKRIATLVLRSNRKKAPSQSQKLRADHAIYLFSSDQSNRENLINKLFENLPWNPDEKQTNNILSEIKCCNFRDSDQHKQASSILALLENTAVDIEGTAGSRAAEAFLKLIDDAIDENETAEP